MKQNLPIFRVGQYVRLHHSTTSNVPHAGRVEPTGWRRMTPEETAAWYANHYAAIAAGKARGYDDAGESYLAPQDVTIRVHTDRVYEILRGRVSASQGYGKRSGCCLVRCLLTGEEFYMNRRDLELA